MHKNPFVPQPPPYNPPQPPLPPGPPPPQTTQPDYSAYWAAATAAAVGQPQAQQAYNPQWPSAPGARSRAITASHAEFSMAAAAAATTAAAATAATAAATAAAACATGDVSTPAATTTTSCNASVHSLSAARPWQDLCSLTFPKQHQCHSNPRQLYRASMFHNPNNLAGNISLSSRVPTSLSTTNHLSSNYIILRSKHLPPAKRQKFDGPGSHNRGPQPLPPPPQFQPPPPPSAPRPMSAGSFSSGRGGTPGGGPIGRGGGQSNRGSMMNNRGGTGRGRGGSMYNSGRGGSHGGGHHQGVSGASFRGRGQGHAYPHFSRGGRHDNGSGSFGPRDGAMAPSSSSFNSNSSGGGKKDENRRNFTDFKISQIKDESLTEVPSSLPSTGSEDIGCQTISQQIAVESADLSNPSINSQDHSDTAVVKEEEEHSTSEMPAPSVIPPPPSRMRIYFHSPVTPDDSRPIPNGASFTMAGSDETGSRRGKRKKLEDDDGDLEEGRAPPPPPGGSRPEQSMSDDRLERASAAPSIEPSVAETASEGDWLMAAIGEDEGDGEDEAGDPELPGNDPHSGDGGDYTAEVEYGSFEDGVATQVDDSDGVRDMAESLPSLMDGQALDNIHEAPSVDSLAATQAVGVPETQDLASSLDTSGGTDMAVVTQSTVAPHPEQLDGAPSGPFEVPVSIDAQNELAASAPPSEEGVISPSSSAPAVPDSSVLASSSSSDTSVAAPPTELAALDEEQPTDHSHSPDVPAPTAPEESTTSSASIIERSLTQEDNSFGDPHVTGVEDTQYDPTQVQFDGLSSSDTSTLEHVSRLTSSTYGEPNQLPIKAEPQRGVRTPSANRLSISYAAGTKRLVINAEIVEKFKVLRSDGRVEISLRVEKDDANELNGIIIEGLSEATKSYSPLETPSAIVESDPTVPPFSKVNVPSEVTLLVYLDTERPLSEPKWVKSGDVHEWLKSMFGRMFWVTGDADGWEKKVQVSDPDPAPTIWTVLDGWAANSPVGLQTERQRFVRTHMAETDHILEILLRLVRGERATPFTQAAPAISAPSVAGPLLAALSPGSAHGPQQTHVSLAVLALWRMTEDYAAKALPEKGRAEAEQRLGEIIRCLPSHLLYKSLDGMFKEWKVEKKSGR
ncbi:hypothetical protein H4582DRAFT_1988316 [Lactarius indigo]|nr:hypothetical protein H4582DRAFT_1988316 [Lactarius indigo]